MQQYPLTENYCWTVANSGTAPGCGNERDPSKRAAGAAGIKSDRNQSLAGSAQFRWEFGRDRSERRFAAKQLVV